VRIVENSASVVLVMAFQFPIIDMDRICGSKRIDGMSEIIRIELSKSLWKIMEENNNNNVFFVSLRSKLLVHL